MKLTSPRRLRYRDPLRRAQKLRPWLLAFALLGPSLGGRVSLAQGQGTIATLAGGVDGPGIPATSIKIDPARMMGMSVDGAGNLYLLGSEPYEGQPITVRRVTAEGRLSEHYYLPDNHRADGIQVDDAGGMYFSSSLSEYFRGYRKLTYTECKVLPDGTEAGCYTTFTCNVDPNGPQTACSGAEQSFLVAGKGVVYIQTTSSFNPGGSPDIVPRQIYTLGADGALKAVKGVTAVVMLTVDRLGNLYYLTSREGEGWVYRTTAQGEVTPLFKSIEYYTFYRASPGGVLHAITYPSSQVVRFDGQGRAAPVAALSGVPVRYLEFDAQGNMYVYKIRDNRILKVAPDGKVQTWVGGGATDDPWDGYNARGASLDPRDIATDAAGNAYFISRNRVRKVTPDRTLSTVAGNSDDPPPPGGPIPLGDGGPATGAVLNRPQGIALDPAGNLYIADTDNRRVLKVSAGPDGVLTGSDVITTVAGGGSGAPRDGVSATAVEVHPDKIAADSAGGLFILEKTSVEAASGPDPLTGPRVRWVDPSGRIYTLAGTGQVNFTGPTPPSGTRALGQPLLNPTDIALDPQGNLLVVDGYYWDGAQPCANVNCNPAGLPRYDHLFRITPSGEISNIGKVNGTLQLALDGSGTLYATSLIAPDLYRVVRVRSDGSGERVAGGNYPMDVGEGGEALFARIAAEPSIAFDAGGNLLISEGHRVRKVSAVGAAGVPVTKPFVPSPLKGDLNGDGHVDIADAILSLRIITGLESTDLYYERAGDLNGQPGITVEDVIRLLQYLVGLRPDLDDHPPLSDDFTGGLSPFWKAKQVRGATPFPAPSAVAADGRLSLSSADSDIWAGVWEPYYVYQDGLYGDFTMQVKVESLPGCSDLSAAGLMAAQSVPDQVLDPSQIPNWGAVLATRDYGTEAKWGGAGRSETSFPGTINAGLKPPYWLRMDRRGPYLFFLASTDGGSHWTDVGGMVNMAARGWPLSEPMTAGIVQQTHCGETPGTVVVSHFQAGPESMVGKLPGEAAVP